jgi:uncharacterized repeat protein (TIGR01451 family)
LEGHVIARVQIPLGATDGTSAIPFTATSTLDSSKNDTISNNIIVPKVGGVTFEPDRSGTGIPGGTVTYSHSVTNTGNATDTYNLSLTSPAGWTYVFYDAGNNPITQIINLGVGTSVNISLKGFIPTGAPVNTIDPVTLKATSTNSPAVNDAAIDTTVVIAGVLQLNKTVSAATGKPGDILTYSINYKNLSSGLVKDLMVVDPVPQYTTFNGYDNTVTGPGGVVLTFGFSDNGVTYYATPAAVPGGAPAVRFVRWTFVTPTNDVPASYDSSAAAGKTLSFSVRIN